MDNIVKGPKTIKCSTTFFVHTEGYLCTFTKNLIYVPSFKKSMYQNV